MAREVRPLAEQGVDPLDDKVRARLAEIRAAAGVAESQITMEILFFLPKGFITAYADMFTRALKADGGESARNSSQHEAGEVGKASGGSSKTGKRYKRTFVVLDERALQLKTTIDKRLRMIARDIVDELAGAGGIRRGQHTTNCGSCGMFVKADWKFCPMDGMLLA